MTTKLEYHNAIKTIATHGLLSLYMHKAVNQQFVPVEKQNKIIADFLKTAAKKKGYAPAKNEIKTLLAYSKPQSVNGRKLLQRLDKKLEALLSHALTEEKKFSDADRLYMLMTDLYEHYGIESQTTPDNLNERFTIDVPTVFIRIDEINSAMPGNTQCRPLQCELVTKNIIHVEQMGKCLIENNFFNLEINAKYQQNEYWLVQFQLSNAKSTLSLAS
jgi:hypothetical protein